MDDSYVREFDATIISCTGNIVVLDTTAFSPKGGGLPSDRGTLQRGDLTYEVVEVEKKGGEVNHVIKDASGLKAGDSVKGVIDWKRRHTIMRYHTACHVLAAVLHAGHSALITGNQIDVDQSRMDFSVEAFDRDILNDCVGKANDHIARDMQVRIYTLEREKAMEIPGIVKLAKGLPPELKTLRIVEIGDVDIQADGGVHVARTGEIGRINIQKLENKGKSNRRVYLALSNP
jgi:Ser-tRNA(Ala) deacylase AlaX